MSEANFSKQHDSPGVIALPPLLYIGTLVAGLILHVFVPIHPLPPVLARVVGACLFVASGAFSKWGRGTMVQAGTNVHPDRPATVLVIQGPFRFTRNPLYLGLIGLYIGIALLVDALWPLVLLLPLLVIMEWGVVRREERYLEAKFGDSYREYKTRVRRWF